MKVAIFLTVALISFTIFTLGVASLPVTSFPYKSSASYVYPISYNPGLWKPFSITGFQILEFQGAGPTITTFTLDLTDSNGDGKANINENVNLLCSATDSNGLNFILITVNRPDGGLTDYGSGGAAGGATDWTIPSTTVNLVSAGAHTLICTAKNVNGTSTTSTKTLEVVTASIACNPSSTSSSDGCKDSSSCQAAGGKWCMGSGYSNPYCDVQSATCTTPSMCGDGDCDKGESGTPSAPQSIMCPQDCGGSPSPSSSPGTSCNVDPSQYTTQTSCASVGCSWCSQENRCRASGSSCTTGGPSIQCNSNGVCDSGESQTTCSIDCGISSGYLDGCGTGKCGDGSCNTNCNVQEDWYICCTDCPKPGTSNVYCPKPGTTPSTSPIASSCSTADPSGCQTESACKATGANWCATTSGSFCSKSATCSQVPTPIILPNQTIQPTPIPRNLTPTKPVTVLKSEILTISDIIQALTPTEIPLTEDLINFGFQKITLETTQTIQVNTTIEVKLLDNIPIADEKNQTLFLPDESPVKVLQISPDQSIQNSTKQAEIQFTLTDQELASNNLKPEDVILARFDNGWQELQTTYVGNQAGIHQFKSTTTGFSVFIVTRKKQSEVEPTPTTSPTPEIDRMRDKQLIKSNLLGALITIEQFKIRFDQLALTSKKIADYYLAADKPQDYTNWFAISIGFSDSIIKLDDVRRDIKSIRDEPTQQDLERIENNIEEVLKILDSSIDFLLKDVLDIGVLEEEVEIPIAVNQSIKFEVNGEEHTLTVESISPTGEVSFVVQSETQELTLTQGEETNLTVASTSLESDTNLKVNKVEKNVVYLTIKSTFLTGLVAAGKDISCLEVTANLNLDPLDPSSSKCFNIMADNIALDGKGKRIDGGGLQYGIKAEGRTGVTIKNFVLVNYLTGIKLVNVRDSTITGMEINAISGIEVEDSTNNKIVNNKIHLTSIGDIEQEEADDDQEIVLNEVILNDAGNGAYTPLISITNNLDPSNFSDANGNMLTTLDLVVETTIGTDLTVLEEPIKFKRGQTKLVNTGSSAVPIINGDNGYMDLKIKITALGGTVTKEFTKTVSLKGN